MRKHAFLQALVISQTKQKASREKGKIWKCQPDGAKLKKRVKTLELPFARKDTGKDECSSIAACLRGCLARKAFFELVRRSVRCWCALLGVIQIRQLMNSR